MRKRELTPHERAFRLDRWVDRHLTLVEKSGPEWLCVCPECGKETGQRADKCGNRECKKYRQWVLGERRKDGVYCPECKTKLRELD